MMRNINCRKDQMTLHITFSLKPSFDGNKDANHQHPGLSTPLLASHPKGAAGERGRYWPQRGFLVLGQFIPFLCYFASGAIKYFLVAGTNSWRKFRQGSSEDFVSVVSGGKRLES